MVNYGWKENLWGERGEAMPKVTVQIRGEAGPLDLKNERIGLEATIEPENAADQPLGGRERISLGVRRSGILFLTWLTIFFDSYDQRRKSG